MSTHRVTIWSAMVLGMLGLSLAPQNASAHGPRQYYGNWNKHPTHNYQYRNYYFKPTTNYVGYKHHYVIHHPQHPNHHYFYNPHKKQYWGRCEIDTHGQSRYSLLAEKDRKGSLKEIPESAFPAPSELPSIPESTDKVPLDLPPNDLPDPKTPGIPAPAPPAED